MEYFTAGGGRAADDGARAGRDGRNGSGREAAETSRRLQPEGRAMLDALLEDLASLGGVRPAALVAPRAGPLPPGVERLHARGEPLEAAARALRRRSPTLFWPVAPESGRTLARLVRRAREAGAEPVGPTASGIGAAADRARLLRRLARAGLRVPRGGPAAGVRAAREKARALGLPAVVKPGRGAGGVGVTLVRREADVAAAWWRAARAEPALPPLVQRYVPGPAASVTVLAGSGGGRALALARQEVVFVPEARYRGGSVPYAHPQAERAREAARRAADACPGLRGLVGVDLVLGRRGPMVVEINPRLTTSYLGLRAREGARLARAGLRLGAGLPRGIHPPRGGAPGGGGPAVRFRPGGTVRPVRAPSEDRR